jgi:uncharacterized protein YqeY
MSQTGVRERLSLALRDALRRRDAAAIAVLRTALAAIANAEAVSADALPATVPNSQHVAGAATGLGAADVPRRELSEAKVTRIVRTEVTEREQAADQYAAAGQAERAARLRAEAGTLLAVLLDPAVS